MRRTVVTTYLEMRTPAELRRARPPPENFPILRAEVPCPELNAFLYAAVGASWHWYQRRAWSHAQWHAWLDRPELETWVGYVGGNPAGYFELEFQADAGAEIAYFGLLPQFIGRGLGGPLLTAAIERGWERGAERVWVHTCNLDHPSALRNYLARGLRIYDRETETIDLPDGPLEPWSGSRATG
jgi:GNAT superfamily N-acetyltransferase